MNESLKDLINYPALPDVSISDPNTPTFHLCKPEIADAVKRYWVGYWAGSEQALSGRDFVLIRLYLHQWIYWCSELGAEHERENRSAALKLLQARVDQLSTRDEIEDWVELARDSGLYPL
jgi:hypothetical protein